MCLDISTRELKVWEPVCCTVSTYKAVETKFKTNVYYVIASTLEYLELLI